MSFNKEEIAKYVKEADPADLGACLKENFEKDSGSHRLMLSEIYWTDRFHFDILSAGCKAAMLIYLSCTCPQEGTLCTHQKIYSGS